MTAEQFTALMAVLERIAVAMEAQNTSVAKIADGVIQAAEAEPPIQTGSARG